MTSSSPNSSGKVLVAALAWISLVQYFVMLIVSESRWTTPYSRTRYAISDLGAVTCHHSDQVEAWVCSPWHTATNVSWVIAGVCLAGGALLGRGAFPRSRGVRVGLGLYVISGLGLLLVGLNPEDTSTPLHVIGSFTAILVGQAAILVLGLSLRRAPGWSLLGWVGVIAGIIAVIASVAMIAELGGPAHFGLRERIAAFPLVIWPILLGLRMVTTRARHSGTPAASLADSAR
ncbi:DUF998 domain-containing protein [Nocardia sp. CA-128927]|uniref:DUF998 domain-containing protein n=1 Tax=Nocardia sp. CA-128927 TaxID=3239975 RepID=UPI003D967EDA